MFAEVQVTPIQCLVSSLDGVPAAVAALAAKTGFSGGSYGVLYNARGDDHKQADLPPCWLSKQETYAAVAAGLKQANPAAEYTVELKKPDIVVCVKMWRAPAGDYTCGLSLVPGTLMIFTKNGFRLYGLPPVPKRPRKTQRPKHDRSADIEPKPDKKPKPALEPQDSATVLQNLRAAVSRREKLAGDLAAEDTNCYRLVHGSGDGFMGLTLDWLGGVLLMEKHHHSADSDALCLAVLKAIQHETLISLCLYRCQVATLMPQVPLFLKTRCTQL